MESWVWLLCDSLEPLFFVVHQEPFSPSSLVLTYLLLCLKVGTWPISGQWHARRSLLKGFWKRFFFFNNGKGNRKKCPSLVLPLLPASEYSCVMLGITGPIIGPWEKGRKNQRDTNLKLWRSCWAAAPNAAPPSSGLVVTCKCKLFIRHSVSCKSKYL